MSGLHLLGNGVCAILFCESLETVTHWFHFTGFGFVTQQPWLQRGTIRENILFGKSFEHNKYK
jgi:ABC-type transport system involved in cytochrome bd biosynthesis fused ATPase/permease subunit